MLAMLLIADLNTVIAQTPPPDAPWPIRAPSEPELAPGVSYRIAEDLPVLAAPTDALDFELSSDILWSIWLPVPRYSQRDPRWANDVMQTCGSTIGQAGCLLTSATMVFRYYGSSMNPGQVNQCMGTYACRWDFPYGANNCSENRATWYGIFDPNYATFVWALSEGYPPILELTRGAGEHWVVIHAVSGNGLQDRDYYIIDPWDGYVKSLTSYTSNGWARRRVAIYGPR